MSDIKKGEIMLFLTSWPSGYLRRVEIIERNNSIVSIPGFHWYVRYLDTNGTDTIHEKFLFADKELEQAKDLAEKRADLLLRTEAKLDKANNTIQELVEAINDTEQHLKQAAKTVVFFRAAIENHEEKEEKYWSAIRKNKELINKIGEGNGRLV